MFPYGAIVSACSMMRRNNEEFAKRRCSDNKSVLVKKQLPTSKIELSINQEDTSMRFEIADDGDWAKAAWLLINVCKEKGQMDNLNHMLENYHPNIKEGSLDTNGGNQSED